MKLRRITCTYKIFADWSTSASWLKGIYFLILQIPGGYALISLRLPDIAVILRFTGLLISATLLLAVDWDIKERAIPYFWLSQAPLSIAFIVLLKFSGFTVLNFISYQT